MFGPRQGPLEPAREYYGQQQPLICCDPTVVGVLSTLLLIVPYTLATALQDSYLHLGLILATAFTGAYIVIGALFFLGGGRRVSLWTWHASTRSLWHTAHGTGTGEDLGDK